MGGLASPVRTAPGGFAELPGAPFHLHANPPSIIHLNSREKKKETKKETNEISLSGRSRRFPLTRRKHGRKSKGSTAGREPAENAGESTGGTSDRCVFGQDPFRALLNIFSIRKGSGKWERIDGSRLEASWQSSWNVGNYLR